MKKTINKTLKIMIDTDHLAGSDLNSIEQWENEGGLPNSSSGLLKSLKPLKRGEIFEVKSGDFHNKNGQLYFEAEIEILSLADKDED